MGSWVRVAAMAAALAVLPLVLPPSSGPAGPQSPSPHASCKISSSTPCSTAKESDSRATPSSRPDPAQSKAEPAGAADWEGRPSATARGTGLHGGQRNGGPLMPQQPDNPKDERGGVAQQQQQQQQQQQHREGVSSSSSSSNHGVSRAECKEAVSSVAAALCKQAVERIARVREVWAQLVPLRPSVPCDCHPVHGQLWSAPNHGCIAPHD